MDDETTPKERPVSQLVTALRADADAEPLILSEESMAQLREMGPGRGRLSLAPGQKKRLREAADALQASEERERELKAELWKAQHPNIEINGGKP
jgi:hypothetical protein